jgi:DNA polymerase-3 subunit delta'
MTTPDEPDRLPGAPHPRETAVLFGQEAAEARFLEAAAARRLHHAWAITGPAGTGKATLAWRIARHIVAGGTAPTLDMAPDHPVFRQLAALASPQLFLARRPWDDKAERLKTAITVDEIRALTAFFHLSAADAGHRVAIIDAADELNTAAANALLKILEEPPARAVLLLVCHRPAALLPTIRSRTRELRLAPLAPEPLAAALAAAGAPANPQGTPLLAALAGGSVGAALRLVSQDGLARYAELVDLLARTPLDRRRAIALAEAAGGRQSSRYDLTVELIGAALCRLALAGSGAPVPALTEAEAAMAARLAGAPAAARIWADLVPRLAERTAHARAVNLDPAQVILDTLLQIDAAAAEARARVA